MMMMDYKEILNKINLRADQILEHLAFLRYFDENQVYLQENVLKQAIHRYVNIRLWKQYEEKKSKICTF